MEGSNQAKGYMHTLKSGETVFFYNDHSTGEQEPLASNNATTGPRENNTSAGCTQTCHNQDVTMHSISTQTDHTAMHTSSIGNGTIYDCPRSNTPTRYSSAATETDLTAVGDRTTLEGILKWALAICRSLPNPDYEESSLSASDESPIPSLHRSTLESQIISNTQIGQLKDSNSAGSSIQAHPVAENAECEQYSDDENHLPSLHERQLDNNLFCNTQMDINADTNAVGSSIQTFPVHQIAICDQYSDISGTIVNEDMPGIVSVNIFQENEHYVHSNDTPIRGKVDQTIEVPEDPHILHKTSDVVKELKINDQEPETEMEEQGSGTYDVPTQVSPVFALEERFEDESGGHGEATGNQQSHMEPITNNPVFFGNTFTARNWLHTKPERSMVVHVPSYYVQTDVPAASGVSFEGQGEHDADTLSDVRTCSGSDGPDIQLERSMVVHVPSHHVHTDLSSASNLTFVPEGVNDTETPVSEVRRGLYMCKVCGKHFSTKGDMAFHSRIHNSERPFECEQCGKRFKSKSHLKVHLPVHLPFDERPYLCTICNKRFTQAGVLKDHLSVHSNDRPFRCTMCGKSFNRPSNLRVHMSLHMKGKP